MDGGMPVWFMDAFRFLAGAEMPAPHGCCRRCRIQARDMACVIEAFRPYPFAEAAFIHARGRGSSYGHERLEGIVQINLCLQGRLGWQLADGTCRYLGAGDVSAHRMDASPPLGVSLPWEEVRDLMVLVDLAKFEAAMPQALQEIGFSMEALLEHSAGGGLSILPLAMAGFPFSAPPEGWGAEHRLAWVRLKVQEFLLTLHAGATASPAPASAGYPQEKAVRIQAVHDYLTRHLAEHATVRELSRRFFMNADDLKKGFKLVYGMPIGKYMQAFRMKRAAELLSGTAMQVQDVAASVGYGHPGKFAQAFRDRMHVSPSGWRKAGERPPEAPSRTPEAEELPGGSSCIGKAGPETTL